MPGTVTFAPACICGITTMKMINSTSTTSTSGVTLMSGRARSGRRTDAHLVADDRAGARRRRRGVPGPTRAGRDPRAALVLDVVEELALGLVDRAEQRVAARGEVVEREHRRDRDDQADRGDDEGLGDTGRDRAEAARALLRDALERADDADHG